MENIAFLTSGGDSPGMNAAIRAIVRMSLFKNATPFAIFEGYKGLVYDKIVEFKWNDVSNLLSAGGTFIKTSRCKEFMEREYRKIGAFNLIKRSICKIIVIGGDGSLSGADRLREEWPEFVDELFEEGKIDDKLKDSCKFLSIVGMVGSIDNDMCGTEITIGANSSLHRIVEAVDSISSTASSHSRAFVIEVMGRNCGWLALNSWIATGADWLFCPESPPNEGWENEMCSALKLNRQLGKTTTIVIVAEGAIDRNNCPIKADYVRDVISEKLELDCRVTTLGHVQRGGNTSAFDRFLATIQGVEAVETILEPHDSAIAVLIGVNQNKITRKPLMESVLQTRSVADAIKAKDFDKAFCLRDAYFKANYRLVESLQVRLNESNSGKKTNIGLVNVGAPCGGMNSANRAVVHYCLNQGYRISGIYNGFHGLESGDVRDLTWADVDSWVSMGGSELGTNRHLPENDLGLIACQLQKFEISALVIVGGFEAFIAVTQLAQNRHLYPAFSIPIICLPATVSNNVPGTDFSIGSDTALNSIMDMCDCIKQSASSSRKRLFVVDVQGGHCGYLATLASIVTGSTYSYIHEEGVRLSDLMREAKHLRNRFSEDKRQGRIILRNEFCSNTYSAEVMSKIFEEEAEGSFDSRWVSLGHIVQGGRPSPLDRIRGTRLAVMAVNYIEAFLCPEKLPNSVKELYRTVTSEELSDFSDNLGSIKSVASDEKSSSDLPENCYNEALNIIGSNSKIAAAVIGIHGPEIKCTSAIELLEKSTILKYRIPKNQWWYPLRQINRIMAKYSD